MASSPVARLALRRHDVLTAWPVYIRGQFVIRHCHLFLYRDDPYKRERGRYNGRRPSSKPGRQRAAASRVSLT
jgi:hypothetical protein